LGEDETGGGKKKLPTPEHEEEKFRASKNFHKKLTKTSKEKWDFKRRGERRENEELLTKEMRAITQGSGLVLYLPSDAEFKEGNYRAGQGGILPF